MDGSTFTAGVVRGGLINQDDIKVLFCLLLSDKKEAIERSILLECLSAEGLANYFECADALSDLEKNGHIALFENGYVITQTGREIAGELKSSVALTVREKAMESLENYISAQRRKNSHNVVITEKDGGYVVRCTVKDYGSNVFALEVFAPDKGVANMIRDNFIDNAEEIMRSSLSLLIKNFK